MRAFHCSWWSFFIAFFIWFAVAPLLSEIRDDIGITKKDVWTSNIVGVGGTIFMRFVLGPMCDKYGARILFSIVLCVASIPTACIGFVHSAAGLAILRVSCFGNCVHVYQSRRMGRFSLILNELFESHVNDFANIRVCAQLFIGVAGGTFVMCQYWASRMFTKEVVGTANALCGGWGNLGGGKLLERAELIETKCEFLSHYLYRLLLVLCRCNSARHGFRTVSFVQGLL